MPLTLLRHATQKPPTGPVKLDMGHPLSQGLIFLLPAWEFGSRTTLDIVGGNQLTLTNGASWGSQYGLWGVVANTTNGGAGAPLPTHRPPTQPPLTLVWKGANLATPSANSVIAGVTYGHNEGAPFSAFLLNWNTSSPFNPRFEWNNGTYQSITGGTRAVGPMWLAATLTSSAQALYVNNPWTPVATGSITTSAISYGVAPYIYVGGDDYDNNNSQVLGEIGHAYNRILSSAELAWLQDEPYAMLKTRTLRRWYTLGGNQLVVPVMDIGNPG